jgi:hypothetical protein
VGRDFAAHRRHLVRRSLDKWSRRKSAGFPAVTLSAAWRRIEPSQDTAAIAVSGATRVP